MHHESKHAVIKHTNNPWGGDDPLGGVKRSFYFYFLKVVMLHIKLKWKKCGDIHSSNLSGIFNALTNLCTLTYLSYFP